MRGIGKRQVPRWSCKMKILTVAVENCKKRTFYVSRKNTISVNSKNVLSKIVIMKIYPYGYFSEMFFPVTQ